jgi:hypothetical protein
MTVIEAIKKAEKMWGHGYLVGISDLWSKDQQLRTVASDWEYNGFDGEEAFSWMAVGGFNPQECRMLAQFGWNPEDAAKRLCDMGGWFANYAYAVCNGDMELEDYSEYVNRIR